eukprot:14303560-Ditylum_brightwellii.AAC.1
MASRMQPYICQMIFGAYWIGGDIPVILTTSSQSMFEESELSWLQQSDTSFFEDYPFYNI